jgi:ankyrin repeat protein
LITSIALLSLFSIYFLLLRDKQNNGTQILDQKSSVELTDTNSMDKIPSTVLEAVLQKDTDHLRKLLVDGKSANPSSGDPISPLHAAVATADTLALRMLLSMGANPNIRDSSGDAPLHDAIRSNNFTAVISLLHMGANPNLKDHYGNSPVKLAKENTQILQILLKNGGH